MLPLLGLVLLVAVFLAIRYRSLNKKYDDTESAFWEREQAANTNIVRELTNLPYITIPTDKFPLDFNEDERIKKLDGQKLLNLTGLTNTDLKEMYGINHLTEIEEMGNNFDEFILILKEYATKYIEDNRTSDAIILLEYAAGQKVDIGAIYMMLADCYKASGQTGKIMPLIDIVKSLSLLTEKAVLDHLTQML